MFGTIPGDIIELNRFLIILVTIATELQGLERCLVANFIRNDMVQGSACGYGVCLRLNGLALERKQEAHWACTSVPG